MRSALRSLLTLSLAAAPALAGGPIGTPTFSDPLDFDNPLFPFEEGAMKVFTGASDGEQTAVVDLYLEETRTLVTNGTPVECHIMQETEFAGGVLVEISANYFAQADDGTVYYFGEVVDIYEDGEVVSHDGSWLVGGPTEPTDPPDAATALVPAVFMPEEPETGDQWKPEDLFPFVDETVTCLNDDVDFKVPAGSYEDGIKVKETSALSTSVGFKWYAPGIGFARSKSSGEFLLLVASTLLPLEDEE